MRYDQEIEREIELEKDDLVELLRNQEVVEDGIRVYISNLAFIKALGRLDPMARMPKERQRELQTENVGEIEVTEMEDGDDLDE